MSNKKDEILSIIQDDDPDIFCLTEILCKRDPTITRAELNIDSYDCFYDEESYKGKRGVVTYVKSDLNAKLFTELDTVGFNESIWCSFSAPSKENILVGTIYHSPSSTSINTDKLIKILNDPVIATFDKVYLMGDYNYPNIDWDKLPPNSTSKDGKFVEAIRDAYLVQHVDKPTRFRDGQKSNVLDLILTKEDTDILNIEYCSPIGKSDHSLMKITTSLPRQVIEENGTLKFDWNKADFTKFRDYINQINWTIIQSMDINDAWNLIKTKIHQGMELFIPKKKPKKKSQRPPWLCNDLRKSIKKKYLAFKRFLESKNSWRYKEYIKVRNKVSKDVKKAKYDYESNIACKCKENPKAFWNHVNSERKCRETLTALEQEGKLVTDDSGKAEVLNNFFSSVFTKEDLENQPHLEPGSKSDHIFTSNLVLTADAVRDKLKSLNVNKSPGPDRIFPRVLKELNEELAQPLTYLFNLSIEKSEVPEEWKLAEVTAIFKKRQ